MRGGPKARPPCRSDWRKSMQIGKLGRWLAAAAVSAGRCGGSRGGAIGHAREREAKGKLVVGVKADYKPFGYTDPSGKIVGLEIDLAQRRREAPRRAGRARSRRGGQPDGVLEAGSHRPHDRDDGLQARSRRGRRHSGAVLLRGSSERLRQEELGAQELGGSQRASRSARSRARTTTAAPARSSARSSPCSRA